MYQLSHADKRLIKELEFIRDAIVSTERISETLNKNGIEALQRYLAGYMDTRIASIKEFPTGDTEGKF